MIERLKQDEQLSKGEDNAISTLKEAIQHFIDRATEKGSEE